MQNMDIVSPLEATVPSEGDTVEWTEWGRLWRGEALRVGVLHTLVRPLLPVGSVNWIATARLTKVARPLAALCEDYWEVRWAGDLGGTEAEALKR